MSRLLLLAWVICHASFNRFAESEQHCSTREFFWAMQSSQSSVTVAFRALIMLAFVIAIPVIAFSGSSAPDNARKLLDKYWPVVVSAVTTAKANILAEAPSYNAKVQNAIPATGQAGSGVPAVPGQLAAGNQAILLPVQASAVNGVGSVPLASNVVPADYQSTIDSRGNIANPAVNSAQFSTNPFTAIQDRLRQLGATYFLLETWGNQRQYFRFYCQMAVGGNASYTHYFEATNLDPLAAMSDVLRQIEVWRSGGCSLQ
jgi:hypothetical protein